MNVILMEKVQNLGELGNTVNVKSGYGRNFLIPKGIAVPATKKNIEIFEGKRAGLEKAAAEKLSLAESRQDKLNKIVVTITHKAGEEGKLFGSVGTADIAEAVTNAGVLIEKREVRLPDGVLRQVGEYTIDIELHGDTISQVKLNILAE